MRFFQTERRSGARWRACHPALALLLATYSAGAASAADTALPDCVPRDTKVVLGIRMRNIVELLQAQNFAAEWRSTSAALLAQTPLAGFDPLKDIDEVIIASTGVGDNPEVLVVLRGRFDINRLATGAASYHG